MPEPLVTHDDPAERLESVSMTLLVLLETLTPLERTVFVLHEVFGYPHPEVAAIVGRSPAAVRQLAHRARGHVHARRPEDLAIRYLEVNHSPISKTPKPPTKAPTKAGPDDH